MLVRSLLAVGLQLLAVTVAVAQGFPPEQAVKRMQLPDGFTARCVASEPTIRQPVSMTFDDRGRLWVLQYLQYPNYAGLKPVKQDQYLRTIWDKFPEPPPRGPRGLDRLTILYDPDEHGVYRKSKDFVSGLNIASGFCLGHGGVFVVQPPYLLFYPDRDQDDVPDSDPDVLLTGFGMDDTHSLANSLQWGPDGWLYGAAGSTSTCKIKNPAGKLTDPPIEFQQGIWRYHPKTKIFELFSEGGGNTYGLDFDKHGQVIAGTNWGGFAMLHQMQGAYHIKGFSKHGPLHNPHTYGYFEHVPYQNFKGGHVTCGGVLYQADTFPKEYRDQYIAANLLSNAIYWHKIEPNGSTFKSRHGGDLLIANDTWFRPVDLMLGPDGSVYVADFTDRRAAHLDPVDNWDKTNGRIYKIEYQGTPAYPSFDLRQKSSAELVELLKHPNVWWRREARRWLAERQDPTTYPILKKMIAAEKGLTALEALWALSVSGGWDEGVGRDLALKHSFEHVRAWGVRLLGDFARPVESPTEHALTTLATQDRSPVVLTQLACTSKRLPGDQGLAVAEALLRRADLPEDPYLPLLLWWALEEKVADHAEKVLARTLAMVEGWDRPLARGILERLARRYAAADQPTTWQANATLLQQARQPAVRAAMLTGIDQALQGQQAQHVPPAFRETLKQLRKAQPDDATLSRILVRLGDEDERRAVLARVRDTARPEAERLRALDLLTQTRSPELAELLPPLLTGARTDTFRQGVLNALGRTDDATVPALILSGYASWSAPVRRAAVAVLLARPAWALELLKAYDTGKLPKADLSLDQARAAVGLNDPAVTALVEKHFGKLAPATAGEKQARIAALNLFLTREGAGDPGRGKAIFAKTCAGCHTLFGEGGKVGPDLTTSDRKNRTYMLTHVVDPSLYIRPEYVSYKVDTVDGRSLTGIVAGSPGETVTLLNVVDNQPQQTTLAKKDIDKMLPSPVSLMPEKLLDTISNDDVRDLFAYLVSDGPPPAAAPARAQKATAKKLKVLLISGSLEYKSEDTLPRLQKYLEANYPVECLRAFRKTDTDLPGLEQLETCDVAIFFTRRLKIEGEQLDRVKKYAASGKPILGIRTASHGFQNWLEMDRLVFGGDYKNHYGAGPKCRVEIAEGAKDHPVLRGVQPFESVGSLYKNPAPAADVKILLKGSIPNHTEPVAWVRERKVNGQTQRVFYTSLGHPQDFEDPNFLRLLVNALAWTTARDLGPAR